MEKCWLCVERYPNKTLLHKHLASKVHTRLRVVCPFCRGQENSFTKISDLKIHSTSTHPDVVVPAGFYSAANGFYMARFPADYKRIVNLRAWDSPEAFEARRLMTEWMKTQRKHEMVQLHWKAGWMAAIEEGPRQSPVEVVGIGEDPEIELREPEVNKRVIIVKKRKEREEEEENLEEVRKHKRRERIENEGGDADIRESRKEVVDKRDRREGSSTSSKGGDADSRGGIKEVVDNRDRREGSSTSRRRGRESIKEVVDNRDRREGSSTSSKGGDADSRESIKEVVDKRDRRDGSSTSSKGGDADSRGGIKEVVDKRDRREESSTSSKGGDADSREGIKEVVDNRDGREGSSTSSKGGDADSRESIKEVVDKTGRIEGSSSKEGGACQEEVVGEESDTGTKRGLEGRYYFTKKGKVRKIGRDDEDGGENGAKEHKEQANKSNDRGEEVGEELGKEDDLELANSDFNDESSEESDSDEESDTMKKKEELKEKQEKLRKEIGDIQREVDKKEEEKKKLKEGPESDLKKRAEKILLTGAMPLCPPGRRNWHGEEWLDLELSTETIPWPPRGFKDMTPDERLLSLEYVAMSLERQQQKSMPRIPRQLLLDTYNFLVLPGTRKAYDQQDQACRKVRYYNHQLVREVAKGNLVSAEAGAIIQAMEEVQKKQKPSVALTLASRLDPRQVGLRLDQD